eukprot:8896602-Alexandrium_andersonii.AAC.1
MSASLVGSEMCIRDRVPAASCLFHKCCSTYPMGLETLVAVASVTAWPAELPTGVGARREVAPHGT